MNTNSSKHHQVVTDKNTSKNTGTNKCKNDKVHQNNCNGKGDISKSCGYLKFSKDNAQKFYKDETFHSLDCSENTGN